MIAIAVCGWPWRRRLVVRFNGLLHLSLPRRRLVVHSYIEPGADRAHDRFFIDFTTRDGVTTTAEYDSPRKFQTILQGVERVL
jgi:hypothetical protein